jgi:hypothetical protein
MVLGVGMPRSSRLHTHAAAIVLSVLVLLLGGCASQRYLQPRRTPVNPLSDSLNLLHRDGPQPTGRTMSLLRHYDVLDVFHRQPELALERLQDFA